MGIKGIYGEIGSGNRVALQKLAIEKFEKTGRPLRIAIDISIWQFQIQSGRGGTNPAIRTLYYRLLRLLSISVQPLFVFDGPHKPTFKRNKRVGANGGMLPNMLTKQLLKLFGFPFHVAPGEAEAECALLQREGIVDAVLSEDVDTLMFGCGWTFRNWSSEGVRGNKSPTHVSAYEAEATKMGKSGLDREGMILVALMSGGDYITEGIPGCGIKVACEAARAGFGKSLCQIPRSDPTALEAWRIGLAHEIQTNECKFFRVKHKALKIPENFPDREVLGYYTHPVVSSASKIDKLKNELLWDGEVDIAGLRQWVAEVFEWKNKGGATKFIRGLAPALLIHKLRLRADRRESGYGDLVLTAMQEMELVRSICGNRVHFSTDGIRELRVVFAPLDIVDINLEAEYDDSEDYGRDGLAPVIDDDIAEPYISDDAGPSTSPSKRGPSLYDPTQLEKAWIPATIVKVGIPLKAEDYEETLRNPKKPVKGKAVPKKTTTKKSGMPKGTLDKFMKITKGGLEGTQENLPEISKKTLPKLSQVDLPPVYLAPSLDRLSSSQASVTKTSSVSTRSRTAKKASIITEPSVEETRTKPRVLGKSKVALKPRPAGDPWTASQSSSLQRPTPSITKPLGQQARTSKEERYDLESSPLASSPSPSLAPTLRRKHSPSPEPDEFHFEPDLPSSSPPRILVRSDQHRSFSDSSTIDQSSPRKKRTPEQIRDLANCLQGFDLEKSLTPRRVNRRLDFSPQAARDRSSSPELPTLIQLCTPIKSHISAQTETITISSSPEATKTLVPKMSWDAETKTKKQIAKRKTDRANDGKKYIMLRESLPGAWREVDEDEDVNQRVRGRSWRVSSVEVLDLTED